MRVRIISLGDIATLDIMETIKAFTIRIASKKQSVNQADIGRAIGGVLQAQMNLINIFKLGKIDESSFDDQIISALEQATGIKLTVKEFNDAWNAMLPDFSKFASLLNDAIDFNNRTGQKIIFISFTNPKDIRHLVEQLNANDIAYKIKDDLLTEIAGIRLLTTYAYQKSKAELIEIAIKELQSNPASRVTMSESVSPLFKTGHDRQQEPQDIKYIRAVNDIKDPVLKEEVDKTNQEIEIKADEFSIETIIWKKFEKQSLIDVLNNTQITARVLSTPML